MTVGLKGAMVRGNAGMEANTRRGAGGLWMVFPEKFFKSSLFHLCRKSWGTVSLTAWRRCDSYCHFPSRPEMSSPVNLRDPSLTLKAIK